VSREGFVLHCELGHGITEHCALRLDLLLLLLQCGAELLGLLVLLLRHGLVGVVVLFQTKLRILALDSARLQLVQLRAKTLHL
jgi:hypothetical protein